MIVIISQDKTVLYLVTKLSGTLIHMLNLYAIEHIGLTLSVILRISETNQGVIIAVLMLQDSLELIGSQTIVLIGFLPSLIVGIAKNGIKLILGMLQGKTLQHHTLTGTAALCETFYLLNGMLHLMVEGVNDLLTGRDTIAVTG